MAHIRRCADTRAGFPASRQRPHDRILAKSCRTSGYQADACLSPKALSRNSRPVRHLKVGLGQTSQRREEILIPVADHPGFEDGCPLFATLKTPARVDRVRAIAKLWPALAGVRIDYAWGGTIGVSLNHVPQMGRLAPVSSFTC